MKRAAALLPFCLLAACHESAAPTPAKVHVGMCTIVYKYWNDRADHSKGAITIRFRPERADDCPDEVTVLWDDDQ